MFGVIGISSDGRVLPFHLGVDVSERFCGFCGHNQVAMTAALHSELTSAELSQNDRLLCPEALPIVRLPEGHRLVIENYVRIGDLAVHFPTITSAPLPEL